MGFPATKQEESKEGTGGANRKSKDKKEGGQNIPGGQNLETARIWRGGQERQRGAETGRVLTFQVLSLYLF